MRPRVWAPFAKDRVEVDVEGRERMRAVGGGWYEAERELAAGARYAFCVDGGPPTPDPRSRSQPDGVHEKSAVDDPAAFRWTDAGFRAAPLASGVVYELHVGCFSEEGTFEGAIAHLDHLVDLGVTHVELLPVVEAPGVRGWGYDGVDLFAPHHAYGGPQGLRALVDACHARGLGVIVDVVYNHLGPTGNYLDRFGPYFTDEHKTPWGRAVNFDQRGSHEVRRFFVDNALMWLTDFHADGLRFDAIQTMFDTSALPILEEIARAVRELERRIGRPVALVAESDLNDPRVVRSLDAHGLGMDAQWSDDFHHALHAVLTGEDSGWYADYGSLDEVARALEGGFVYDGRFARSRNRVHGRPLDDVPRSRLYGYLQTHDQIGNRARGDRISHLVSTERALVGMALVLTSPFVPMLFMGEEWAASTPFQFFCDHEEHLAQSVRDGRRREFAQFGWKPEDIPDPQASSTFAASKLDWSERGRAPHARVLAWTRDLIGLRPRLGPGCRARVEGHTLLLDRDPVVVAMNLGAGDAVVPLPREGGRVLLSSRDARLQGAAVTLAPDSAVVVELTPGRAGAPTATRG